MIRRVSRSLKLFQQIQRNTQNIVKASTTNYTPQYQNTIRFQNKQVFKFCSEQQQNEYIEDLTKKLDEFQNKIVETKNIEMIFQIQQAESVIQEQCVNNTQREILQILKSSYMVGEAKQGYQDLVELLDQDQLDRHSSYQILYAQCLFNLGNIELSEQNLEKSQEYLFSILSFYDKITNKEECPQELKECVGQTYTELGLIEKEFKRDYQEANSYFEISAKITQDIEKPFNPFYVSRNQVYLGQTFFMLQKFEEAIEILEKTYKTIEVKDTLSAQTYKVGCLYLGYSYMRSDLEKCQVVFDEGSKIMENNDQFDDMDYAELYLSKSILCKQQQDRDNAVKFIDQAIEYVQKAGNSNLVEEYTYYKSTL